MAVLTTAYIVFYLGCVLLRLPLAAEAGGRDMMVSAALQQPSAEWTRPVSIPLTLFDAHSPELLLDSRSQRLHLVWEESSDEFAALLRYALGDVTGTHWQLDMPADLWLGDSAALALDTNGLPHVVYARESEQATQIYYRQRTSERWELSQSVFDTTGASWLPDIIVHANGDIHVVWADLLADGDQIHQVYHAANARIDSWHSAEPVPQAFGYAPRLALAPDGSLWLTWHGRSALVQDTTWDVFVANWRQGIWSSPVNVSKSAWQDSRSPDIACDPEGRVYLVWEEVSKEGLSSTIHYAGALVSDGQWSVPQSITGHSQAVERPRLSVGPDGILHAAWDAGNWVEYARHESGEAWSPVEIVVQHEMGVRDVALAADVEGRAHVVWVAREAGDHARLWYARREPSDTPQPSPTVTETRTTSLTATLIPTIPETPDPGVTGTATLTGTLTPPPTITPTQTMLPSVTPEPTVTPTPRATAPTIRQAFLPIVARFAISKAELLSAPTEVTLLAEPQPRAAVAWSWSSPITVSASADDARAASLAIAPTGVAYAVWEEYIPGVGTLLHSSRRLEGEWSTPLAFYAGEDPYVTVTSDGVAHLVYANECFGTYDIYYCTWTGSGWSLPENVSRTSGTSSQPAIAHKSDGTLIVVWTDTTEGQTRIYHGWKASGVWNTYVIPASSGGSAPDVAVGEGQRVWVTWQLREVADPSSRYDVYAIHGNGIQWNSFAINISESTGVDSLAPRLAGIANVGCFLVWQEGYAPGANVYVSDNLVSLDWWAAPYALSASNQAERPAVAASLARDVHVGWEEGLSLQHRRRDPLSGAWQSAASIITSTKSVGALALAAGADRSVDALWSEDTSPSRRDMRYSHGHFVWPYDLTLPLILSP
jgi:hypothetical protein